MPTKKTETKTKPKVAKAVEPKKKVKKETTKAEAIIVSQNEPVIEVKKMDRKIADHPLHKEAKKGTAEFKGKYIESIGRRKTSVARVRFYLNDTGISVNDKHLNEYFKSAFAQDAIVEPLKILNAFNKFGISIKVNGGGIESQSEACRLGIARNLVKIDEKNKPILRAHGLMTRDPRVVERKKYGLHKARRAPQ